MRIPACAAGTELTNPIPSAPVSKADMIAKIIVILKEKEEVLSATAALTQLLRRG